MDISTARKQLIEMYDPQKAAILSRFFKSAPGEYGDGDLFLGVKVPETRAIVKQVDSFDFEAIATLLNDPYHEVRLLGGLILVRMYEQKKKHRHEVVRFYIDHLPRFNNWDLIDLTCYKILGEWLIDQPKELLYQLAMSDNLWVKRASIVSTMGFVRRGMTDDLFRIAQIHLDHSPDLIHKAVGWLLREAGKKDKDALICFLKTHYRKMSRTTLRYTIEKFSPEERLDWLKR